MRAITVSLHPGDFTCDQSSFCREAGRHPGPPSRGRAHGRCLSRRISVPGGFIGVDVFFVISGFVITAMLEREWTRERRIRFTRFYSRRFKRLTPALALMLAVTMVMSALILSPLGPQENAAKTALGAIFLIANFVIARTTGDYFGAPAETNPLLNTWSLSVEEQFYLAFPAVLLVC